MRMSAFLAPLALLAFAGCLDAPRPVNGQSCGTLGPNVRLRAVDRTTSLPLSFTVTVDGDPPDLVQCLDADDNIVSDTPCAGELDFLLVGSGSVVVTSDGYAPEILLLDAGEGKGPCGGPLYDFDLTVPLGTP